MVESVANYAQIRPTDGKRMRTRERSAHGNTETWAPIRWYMLRSGDRGIPLKSVSFLHRGAVVFQRSILRKSRKPTPNRALLEICRRELSENVCMLNVWHPLRCRENERRETIAPLCGNQASCAASKSGPTLISSDLSRKTSMPSSRGYTHL